MSSHSTFIPHIYFPWLCIYFPWTLLILYISSCVIAVVVLYTVLVLIRYGIAMESARKRKKREKKIFLMTDYSGVQLVNGLYTVEIVRKWCLYKHWGYRCTAYHFSFYPSIISSTFRMKVITHGNLIASPHSNCIPWHLWDEKPNIIYYFFPF